MVREGGLGDIHLLEDLARADVVLGSDGLVDAQARGVAQRLERRSEALIINFIRTLPTFIRTCADECGNPIP